MLLNQAIESFTKYLELIDRSQETIRGYAAVEKLGWEKEISAHVLRHSFGSNLLEKGASVVSIQKLLGHSSLRVTSRYLHQDTEKLSEAVNLL